MNWSVIIIIICKDKILIIVYIKNFKSPNLNLAYRLERRKKLINQHKNHKKTSLVESRVILQLSYHLYKNYN